MIRYSFLWSSEARTGATEGRKDRPCAIVVAVPQVAHGNTQVVVVPVTHTAPDNPDTSLALPPSVRAALGLGSAPSWVRLDELNVFAWPGYDLRNIPGTDDVVYGPLPKPLFERIRAGTIALHRARRVRQVNRD
ncbi:MAG TPA: hypothetical protein VGG99_17200 [Acetobacteraceae bacterium]|jgi:hypothetical protein